MNGVASWKKSLKHVLLGLVISLISLDFYCLNYILPIIGMFLMSMEFQKLRRESKWFRICWILMLIKLFGFALWCGLEAAVWRSYEQVQYLLSLINQIQLFFLILIVVLGGIGFYIIKKSASEEKKMRWEKNQLITSKSEKLYNILLTIVVAGMLLFSIGSGYLFFSKYPMEWKEINVSKESEVTRIKQELIALGLPENVAEDLTVEDLRECKGALAVEMNQEQYAMNDGRLVTKKEDGYLSYERVTDVFELQLVSIAIKLSDDGFSWKVIHYFEWTEDAKFIGTEAIEFNIAGELQDKAECSGQVLYDEGDSTYVSSYYSLGSQPKEENMFAAFSFPKNKERCRGYVSYKPQEWRAHTNLSARMIYWHQKSRMQFPAKTALEYAKGMFYDLPRVFLSQDHGVMFSVEGKKGI